MGSAANPWQVVSETPATGAAPRTADPWSVVGETPAAPAAQDKGEGFGDWIENLGQMMRPVSLPGKVGGTMQADMAPQATGGAKAQASGLGGLLDLIHWLGMKYVIPNAPDSKELAQQKVRDHMQEISDYLRKGTEPIGAGENVGYGLEMAAEAEALPEFGAEDLLRVAGTRGAKAADMLANSQELAKTLAKNPKAAKYLAIGIKATKAATEQAALLGGQTYLHTEDPEEARQAAILAGGLGLATGGAEVGAQAWRDRFGPKNLKIGPVEVPALARQVNEKGFAVPGRAEEAPKIQAAQEAAFPAVIGHTAREATAAALNTLNESRPILRPIEDPARLLAPTPVEPPRFTIEGTAPFETQAGPLTQPAEPLPSEEVTPATAGGPWTPERRVEQVGGQPMNVLRERRIPGAMHPVPSIPSQEPTAEEVVFGGATPRPKPAEPGREDVVKGGGPMTTTSLPEAESWLHRLEEVQSSPEYDDMPQQRRAEIEGQRKSLQDQLDMFYSSFKGHPSQTQRFMPIDANEATRHVHTFGDASAQIEAAAKPVYQRLDQLSNGEFNKLRQQAKAAKATMRRAGSIDAYEAAEQRYHEANRGIADLIDSSSPHITQQDYQVARNAWRQSRRLDELDTVFERMMNGVTHEEGELGMPRFVEKARTKAIQNYLDSGTNQQQIQQLIGKEGIINLKNVTNLLSDRATSRASQNVVKEVAGVLAKRFGHVGYGAAAGGTAASFLGMNPYLGSLYGAMGSDALRWTWRYAATTPKVGQMIDMAVRNGVSTKVAAPLISRVIAQTAGLYKPNQQPNEEPTP